MIQTLKITGFRCFQSLEVRNLTRVNLFVGQNNCGKTSLLEAVYTLVRRGDPLALASFMLRRQETCRRGDGSSHELDIRRLFVGHTIEEGATLLLESTLPDRRQEDTRFVIGRMDPESTDQFGRSRKAVFPNDPLFLRIESQRDPAAPWQRVISINSRGGIDTRTTSLPDRVREQLSPAVFVSSDDAAAAATALLWSEIALTENERRVEDCLRVIEPDLLRIAFVTDWTTEPGIFRVKLASEPQPIPLGSMGGGMARLLALAVALVRSQNGYLLVDEIDTGLHHSILEDVWKFVLDVAEKLNIQVYATTHSLDCVRGLARICAPLSGEERISMHRIERGKPQSIHYTERQIVIAATEGIETR